MNQQILEFWKSQGLANIVPNTGKEFPEGWDVRGHLRLLFKKRHVTDIGCGYGRLCTSFDAQDYLGLDINPAAIEEAKRRNPDYSFRTMQDDRDFGGNLDAALLYTVLLHVDDDDIEGFVGDICRRTAMLVIAEIMDRKWRRPGNPPVFNRNADEYVSLLEKCNFVTTDEIALPYSDITFLVSSIRR